MPDKSSCLALFCQLDIVFDVTLSSVFSANNAVHAYKAASPPVGLEPTTTGLKASALPTELDGCTAGASPITHKPSKNKSKKQPKNTHIKDIQTITIERDRRPCVHAAEHGYAFFADAGVRI